MYLLVLRNRVCWKLKAPLTIHRLLQNHPGQLQERTSADPEHSAKIEMQIEKKPEEKWPCLASRRPRQKGILQAWSSLKNHRAVRSATKWTMKAVNRMFVMKLAPVVPIEKDILTKRTRPMVLKLSLHSFLWSAKPHELKETEKRKNSFYWLFFSAFLSHSNSLVNFSIIVRITVRVKC